VVADIVQQGVGRRRVRQRRRQRQVPSSAVRGLDWVRLLKKLEVKSEKLEVKFLILVGSQPGQRRGNQAEIRAQIPSIRARFQPRTSRHQVIVAAGRVDELFAELFDTRKQIAGRIGRALAAGEHVARNLRVGEERGNA